MSTDPDLPDLLDAIVSWDEGTPVRAMEAVAAMGEAATPAIVEQLRAIEDDDVFGTVWLLVLLGLTGGPDAVPPLLAVAASPTATYGDRSVAAEALARLGALALPAVLERLDGDADEDERLWLYAALGSMSAPGAADRLVGALDSDPDFADVIASALAERAGPEVTPHLLRANERAEPWQRPDIEDAIRSVHGGGVDRERLLDADWRLRYRIDPRWGTLSPSWAAVSSIMKKHGAERDGQPARSLDEILADEAGAPAEPARCEDCGEPYDEPTGVAACPETALAIALIQHEWLGQAREDEGIEDLFELLGLAEADALELRSRPEPRSRRERERLADELERTAIIRSTCSWLIGQGIEAVGPARARLLAEALRLRNLYGDPEGLLEPVPPPRRVRPETGRNEPCPCGSGRKYKKCCGRAGAAAPEPAPRAMPHLQTTDGEDLLFCRAHFLVEDAAAARRRLLGHPDIVEDDDPAGPLHWLRDEPDGTQRVLGGIRIEGESLVLECQSNERLARGRALIEAVAGDLVRHRLDTLQDPWQAAADAPARPAGVPDHVPTEAERAAIRAVLERHYRSWPDHPVPALDGRTPREAVRTKQGRRAVAELLHSFEEAGPEAADDPMAYDFGWLWEELGIGEMR